MLGISGITKTDDPTNMGFISEEPDSASESGGSSGRFSTSLTGVRGERKLSDAGINIPISPGPPGVGSASPGGSVSGSPLHPQHEFTADVVPGKFLFVGLGGSGKSTLINLMSVKRRFQSALPQQCQPDVTFMLPSSSQTLHDPISAAMSQERRGSTVVNLRTFGAGKSGGERRKTVSGVIGQQGDKRANKLGGGSKGVMGGRRENHGKKGRRKEENKIEKGEGGDEKSAKSI